MSSKPSKTATTARPPQPGPPLPGSAQPPKQPSASQNQGSKSSRSPTKERRSSRSREGGRSERRSSQGRDRERNSNKENGPPADYYRPPPAQHQFPMPPMQHAPFRPLGISQLTNAAPNLHMAAPSNTRKPLSQLGMGPGAPGIPLGMDMAYPPLAPPSATPPPHHQYAPYGQNMAIPPYGPMVQGSTHSPSMGMPMGHPNMSMTQPPMGVPQPPMGMVGMSQPMGICQPPVNMCQPIQPQSMCMGQPPYNQVVSAAQHVAEAAMHAAQGVLAVSGNSPMRGGGYNEGSTVARVADDIEVLRRKQKEIQEELERKEREKDVADRLRRQQEKSMIDRERQQLQYRLRELNDHERRLNDENSVYAASRITARGRDFDRSSSPVAGTVLIVPQKCVPAKAQSWKHLDALATSLAIQEKKIADLDRRLRNTEHSPSPTRFYRSPTYFPRTPSPPVRETEYVRYQRRTESPTYRDRDYRDRYYGFDEGSPFSDFSG